MNNTSTLKLQTFDWKVKRGDEFKKTLQGIIDKLSGATAPTNVNNVVTAPDGEQIIITD